jgi:hypothetical protein
MDSDDMEYFNKNIQDSRNQKGLAEVSMPN